MRRAGSQENPVPEPDGRCPHCNEWYEETWYGKERVELSDFKWIEHVICPHCKEVVRAYEVDGSDHYFSAWRRSPETMEKSIDNYIDLKDYGR